MKIKFILTFVILLLQVQFVFSSHLSVGQVTYKHIGGNFWAFKFTHVWDCKTGFALTGPVQITAVGCGQTVAISLNQSTLTPGQGVDATDVSPCVSDPNVVCKKLIEFEGIVELSPCESWIVSWGSSARNSAIYNLTSAGGIYVDCMLNSIDGTTNSSPYPTNQNLPVFCVNQPACFNLAIAEPDGNTLVYSLVSASISATAEVTYATGMSGTNPIPGILLNSATGQISFVAAVQGDYVVCVKVSEYNAAGQLIGYIIRDFTIVVANCFNQTPPCGDVAMSNISPPIATPTPNIIEVCAGTNLFFDMTFTDPDPNDILTITSTNFTTNLPGATYTLTNPSGLNTVKFRANWVVPPIEGYNSDFVLTTRDNFCPIPGKQQYYYKVLVRAGTYAGPDKTICGVEQTSLAANYNAPDNTMEWHYLNGALVPTNPLQFNCNPCKNPTVMPITTTTYVLYNTGVVALGCKQKDTVVVNVVPDFTITASVNLDKNCLKQPVLYTSTVSPANTICSYTWLPGEALLEPFSASSSAVYQDDKLPYKNRLIAISNYGCTRVTPEITCSIYPVTVPIFSVVPTLTVLCANQSMPMSFSFANIPPQFCSKAPYVCSVITETNIGFGSIANGPAEIPAIYITKSSSFHTQILYYATELQAANIRAGKLNSISFQLLNLNGVTDSFKDFTIRLKCTSKNKLSQMETDGFTQVYTAANFPAPTTGGNIWITHQFQTAYNWDGTSNIIVELYNDIYPNLGNNMGTIYATTSQNTVLTYTANGANAFSTDPTKISVISKKRPVIKLGWCLSQVDPNMYSYQWTPTVGLTTNNTRNTVVQYSASTIYTLVVTPTAVASCSNTSTGNIVIMGAITPTLTATSQVCSNMAPVTVSSSTNGGVFASTGYNNVAGIFYPNLASIGNNLVTYILGPPACQKIATININVEQFVNSAITGTITPKCVIGNTFTIPTNITAVSSGTWSGLGTLPGNVFSPTVAGVGVNTLTHSTQSNPTASLCPSSSTINVLVVGVPQPTISNLPGLICNTLTPLSLTITPANLSGGVFSCTNSPVSISSIGTFSPIVSGAGLFNIQYIYTGVCNGLATATISVSRFNTASLSRTIVTLCEYDQAIDLKPYLFYTGGVWSGTGITSFSFNPQIAGPGIHVITYNTDSSPSGVCPDMKQATVTVAPKPSASGSVNLSFGCQPHSVTLTTNQSSGNATWYLGYASNTLTGLSTTYQYPEAGIFTVSLSYTNAVGCKNDIVLSPAIEVFPLPKALFDVTSKEVIVLDGVVSFLNKTTDVTLNSYDWYINNQLWYVTQNVIDHSFINVGEQIVTLKATNAFGCSTQTYQTIRVVPNIVIYAPNAFTPGDTDDYNNSFYVHFPLAGINFSTFKFEIYNKLGQILYETKDYTKAYWHGTTNNIEKGDILPNDVYVWKLQFYDDLKKIYIKTGNVLLLKN